MAFTPNQVEALSAKLDRANVKERSQAGRSLSYIEGWLALSEANRIFGFDAWDRETVELVLLGEPTKDSKDLWRVGYRARVRITVRAGDTVIVREGCGFGSGIDRDINQAHESALKEGETDATKRCLMTFGNPFGLALYDKTQENVESAAKPPPPKPPAVMSGAVLAAKAAIDMCADEQALDDWGIKNSDAIKAMDQGDQQLVREHYSKHRNVLRNKQKEAA